MVDGIGLVLRRCLARGGKGRSGYDYAMIDGETRIRRLLLCLVLLL
jgi:hypothetical protein